jgi:WhiB family redox-sensing transcriptional regulator
MSAEDFVAAFRSSREALLWQEGALCAQTDPDAFFPEKGGTTLPAKRVCAVCDVRADCLAYAFRTDERFGIWGGMSAFERHKARKAAEATEDSGVAA